MFVATFSGHVWLNTEVCIFGRRLMLWLPNSTGQQSVQTRKNGLKHASRRGIVVLTHPIAPNTAVPLPEKNPLPQNSSRLTNSLIERPFELCSLLDGVWLFFSRSTS